MTLLRGVVLSVFPAMLLAQIEHGTPVDKCDVDAYCHQRNERAVGGVPAARFCSLNTLPPREFDNRRP
jgi:hypothetical protein